MYALVDTTGTGTNVTAVTVLTQLNTPNGVAYANGRSVHPAVPAMR